MAASLLASDAPTLESTGQLLWRIPTPKAGLWTVLLRGSGQTSPNVILVESALISDLILEGFLGLPPEERIVGKAMPILANLSDIDPISGAAVKATSERTGEVVTLLNDGQHGDGAALLLPGLHTRHRQEPHSRLVGG